MEVEQPDLEAAAAATPPAARAPRPRPPGLGPDGHTASLVPGDPVLSVTDRLVGLDPALPGPPADDAHVPALARARQLLWLDHRGDKQPAACEALGRRPLDPRRPGGGGGVTRPGRPRHAIQARFSLSQLGGRDPSVQPFRRVRRPHRLLDRETLDNYHAKYSARATALVE